MLYARSLRPRWAVARARRARGTPGAELVTDKTKTSPELMLEARGFVLLARRGSSPSGAATRRGLEMDKTKTGLELVLGTRSFAPRGGLFWSRAWREWWLIN